MYIRSANSEDYKSIIAIAKDSDEPTAFTNLTALRKHRRTAPFQNAELFVAVGQGVVGYAEILLGQWSERGKYTHRSMVGTINELVVPLSVRNRGIGTALLEACEQRLSQMGALISFIEIAWENIRSQRFLEKRGYEVNSKWKWAERYRQKLKKIIS
ncbi:MAG: N-acetyltransferase family protein [Candidatus Ranarchaeia archaeon]|jgi:ribosomal protein S18 acetylase RimI-like enzyme